MAKKKRVFRNPNGYGSVVKLGGNRRKPFASRVTMEWVDGKQVYKYIGYFERREDAMSALADYNRGLLTIETNSVTFKELAERWLEVGTKEMNEGSIRVYNTSFKNCKALYKHKVVDINADAIQRMLDDNGKSKSTNIQIRSFIKQVFDYAIANKVVSFSPVSYVKVRGTSKRDGIRFTEKEIQWLWDNQDKPLVDVILVLLYTGMRVSELLSLPMEVVNLEERYLIWGCKTEAGKNRIIPISKKIMPIMEKLVADPTSSARGIKYKGRKLSYSVLREAFHRYLIEMKGDSNHVIHDLRRTTMSMLSDADVPLTTIQKIVGHKPTDVTSQVYINKSVESLVKAIDKI